MRDERVHSFLASSFDADQYDKGKAQLLWRVYHNDCLTPVAAALRLNIEQPYHFLLESVEGGSRRGRYSVIGLAPDAVWRFRGQRAQRNDQMESDEDAFVNEADDVLTSLRRFLDDSRLPMPPSLPSIAHGVFGYLAYDTIRHVEKRLCDASPHQDTLDLWDGVWMRPRMMLVFDSVTDSLIVTMTVRPQKKRTASKAHEQAQQAMDELVARLKKPSHHDGILEEEAIWNITRHRVSTSMEKNQFEQMVARAKEYIVSGDIFQVVLSQRFTVACDDAPFTFYRRLRRLNPSPFLFFIHIGDAVIAGSSPEILVRLQDGQVIIRPIAGTRPRGGSEQEDRELAQSLKNDSKEVAEHLMLLDLGRNDVGRASRMGSVTVAQQMMIEHYSHVMHMVSEVRGSCRQDMHPLDVMLAGFPAGTVSGAPKIRAMQIIDECEPTRRGLYAGAIGYFAANGEMDSCIALRTAVIKDGKLHVQAGGGIVHDSQPVKEWEESCHKAQALLKAAGGFL